MDAEDRERRLIALEASRKAVVKLVTRHYIAQAELAMHDTPSISQVKKVSDLTKAVRMATQLWSENFHGEAGKRKKS